MNKNTLNKKKIDFFSFLLIDIKHKKLIKIFDNGKLRCFKSSKKKEIEQTRSCDLQSFDEESFNIFVEELDLLKMITYGESSKHNNCV
ncbi:hypothetical protein RFI_35531 [Reticulomyxa filosa]|uniref:Uncharacterized protein n=1 Tax=Reticulomyxa filosa TaxID=46433 RepID=X6LJZ8_RETFI|nr:hypothetical protein RFI_35531 [Reticulomyxa filosa]|eukprot:ETO01909.1 hypothetical protein RFI_35531 [Reticulomyxa filosa]